MRIADPGEDMLQLQTVVDDAKTTLLVGGELDLSTRGRFRHEIERILALGAVHVVVDASTVSFVDSSGLSALVGAKRHATEVGAGFEVRPSRQLRSLLERTALLGHFATTT